MGGFPEIIVLILVSVVLPLVVVLHYVTKWKDAKGLSPEDEKMIEDV